MARAPRRRALLATAVLLLAMVASGSAVITGSFSFAGEPYIVDEGENVTVIVDFMMDSDTPLDTPFATVEWYTYADDPLIPGFSATPDSDYNSTSGTLTFPAGQWRQSFSLIHTVDDTEMELSTERFYIGLRNPSSSYFRTTTYTLVYIKDNDKPYIRLNPIGNVDVMRPQAGQKTNIGSSLLTVVMTKSPGPGCTINMADQTLEVTATRNVDFEAPLAGSSLTYYTWDENNWNQPYTIPAINVLGSNTPWTGTDVKYFTVNLASPRDSDINLAQAKSSGCWGTVDPFYDTTQIAIHQPPPVKVSITASQTTVKEPNPDDTNPALVTLIVKLSAQPASDVRVDFWTQDGTAQAGPNGGGDYGAIIHEFANTLLFTTSNWQQQQAVNVSVNRDLVTPEPDETFIVFIAVSSGQAIVDSTASAVVVTIKDTSFSPTDIIPFSPLSTPLVVPFKRVTLHTNYNVYTLAHGRNPRLAFGLTDGDSKPIAAANPTDIKKKVGVFSTKLKAPNGKKQFKPGALINGVAVVKYYPTAARAASAGGGVGPLTTSPVPTPCDDTANVDATYQLLDNQMVPQGMNPASGLYTDAKPLENSSEGGSLFYADIALFPKVQGCDCVQVLVYRNARATNDGKYPDPNATAFIKLLP